MSRYRLTIWHAPGNRGHRRQCLELDAVSPEKAAWVADKQHGYLVDPEDIECLWEGDEEPMDRQLRRAGSPQLPGLE